jgi:hypothetical protein
MPSVRAVLMEAAAGGFGQVQGWHVIFYTQYPIPPNKRTFETPRP